MAEQEAGKSQRKPPTHVAVIGIGSGIAAMGLGLGILFGLPAWLFLIGLPITILGMLYFYVSIKKLNQTAKTTP